MQSSPRKLFAYTPKNCSSTSKQCLKPVVKAGFETTIYIALVELFIQYYSDNFSVQFESLWNFNDFK